jgi:REP element-mobilizing transposase RayT
MGRQRRPYLPGAIFHIAARTLGRRRLLEPRLRTRALHLLAQVLPGSGARLLSVAIMANHLHLVVQQGIEPLSRLMHGFLRRLALEVQSGVGVEGPVFWRPYASQPCMDPNHVRNAIVYTHLNPVRAGMCNHPSAYPWTSHALYVPQPVSEIRDPLRHLLDPNPALLLFASGPDRRGDELRLDYERFVGWRLMLDRLRTTLGRDDPALDPAASPWAASWGNCQWGNTFSPLFHSRTPAGGPAGGGPSPDPAPDLADIARAVLAVDGCRIPLEAVKGRGGSREHARVRARLVLAMRAAGHRSVTIARFLRLSESGVSRIVRATEARPVPGPVVESRYADG